MHADKAEVFYICCVLLQDWINSWGQKSTVILDEKICVFVSARWSALLDLYIGDHDNKNQSSERKTVNYRSQLVFEPVGRQVFNYQLSHRLSFPEKNKVSDS